MILLSSPFGPRPRDDPGGGGVVLPIVRFTGRLRTKGVPFLSSQFIKGQGKLPF